MNETHILIKLLRMYVPQNWEFGSPLAKLRNFGGGVGGFELPNLAPFSTPLVYTNQELVANFSSWDYDGEG
jgi:hypothetical protein